MAVVHISNQGGASRRPTPTAFVQQVARRVDVPVTYARDVLTRSIFPYRRVEVRKRTGGQRILHSPELPLMRMQRLLLDDLLPSAPTHASSYGYVPGASVLDCASVHLRSHTVVRIDIADFFSSITERHIFRALSTTGWPSHIGGPVAGARTSHVGPRMSRLLAYELAVLTTVSPPGSATWPNRGTGSRVIDEDSAIPRAHPYSGQTEGFLPQGSPTSGALSNLVMRPIDDLVHDVARRMHLRFSRYSDDLFFSSTRPITPDTVARLVHEVRAALQIIGLHVNDSKTRVARPGSRRTVLGVLVDQSAPRVGRDVHRRIDMHLHGSRRFGIDEHAEHRGFIDPEDFRSHMQGLISWIQIVEPGRGHRYAEDWARAIRHSRLYASPDLALGESIAALSPVNPPTESAAKQSIDDLIVAGVRYRSTVEYLELLRFIERFHHYAPSTRCS
ncbi:hypothetical protein ENKNEFLB_03907 [Nocardioides aquaticus]|uniref:RNA-directed DNA polymerase n=2 Tax=Actinomycetes TaxID=1760 RepID=A0ABX8EQ48_9ACTN|nr:hypothetical protein ENKNEFLB_03907 [Nocardioides aquaticus]